MAYTIIAVLVLGLTAVLAVPHKGWVPPVKSAVPAPAPPVHTVVDACTCESAGNYFSTSYSDHCTSYTIRTAFLGAQTMNCPLGTKFDVQSCTCAHVEDSTCAYKCGGDYYHDYKSVDYYKSHDYCVNNGNTYQQMPGTHCTAFLQSTAELTPVKFYCPAGLRFNLDLCVCDFHENTRCYY